MLKCFCASFSCNFMPHSGCSALHRVSPNFKKKFLSGVTWLVFYLLGGHIKLTKTIQSLLNFKIWLSLALTFFFKSASSKFTHNPGAASCPCFKIALSLNWSFDRCRHVLGLFNASFNKNIELKRCMISSIDCARKSTIDFPVCYATRNLFGTFAVLTKNLNLFNIWESITAAFKWISPGRLRCAITSTCLGTCLNKSRCMKDHTPHEAVFQKILLTSLY